MFGLAYTCVNKMPLDLDNTTNESVVVSFSPLPVTDRRARREAPRLHP